MLKLVLLLLVVTPLTLAGRASYESTIRADAYVINSDGYNSYSGMQILRNPNGDHITFEHRGRDTWDMHPGAFRLWGFDNFGFENETMKFWLTPMPLEKEPLYMQNGQDYTGESLENMQGLELFRILHELHFGLLKATQEIKTLKQKLGQQETGPEEVILHEPVPDPPKDTDIVEEEVEVVVKNEL